MDVTFENARDIIYSLKNKLNYGNKRITRYVAFADHERKESRIRHYPPTERICERAFEMSRDLSVSTRENSNMFTTAMNDVHTHNISYHPKSPPKKQLLLC